MTMKTHSIVVTAFAVMGFSGCANTPIESVIGYPETAPTVKFIESNVVPVSSLWMVSKFRSSAGHDYSDKFETNRSMKHYFYPINGEARNLQMCSPVDGVIYSIEPEKMANAGDQVKIMPSGRSEYVVIVFHVGVAGVKAGDHVRAGQVLGTNISMSFDVAVWRKDGRLVSWFDVISDSLFEEYKLHGALNRSDFIISREYRDAHPIQQYGSNDPNEVFTFQ